MFRRQQQLESSQHARVAGERSLVRRLDIFLMTFGCISQIIKIMDQTNVNNAYVSGMKEDLHLEGNELNYFTTYFNVGYCLMLIPSLVVLTYVRPSLWLSGLEVTWGILTGLIATTHNAKQVYAIRFFLGLCESSAWPGMMTLFMHWYTPYELAKRMGFYHSCQAIGSMMSGAIQAAISSTLDNRSGIEGWRWLFIISAIITVVWGVLGLFMLPDLPNRPNPRAVWFTSEHAKVAMDRLARHGREEPRRVSLAGAKRTFTSLITLLIAVMYCCIVLGDYSYNYFGLFLKSLKNPITGKPTWSTAKVNAIPISGSAIQTVFIWFWAVLSDYLQLRWPLIVAQATIALAPLITMSVWTHHPSSVSLAAPYAAFFIQYMTLGTAPLIFSWLADLIPQDPELRTLVVGVAITSDYAIQAWSNPLMWPAEHAPFYLHGYPAAVGLMAGGILTVFAVRWWNEKALKGRREVFRTVIEEERQGNGDDGKVGLEGDAVKVGDAVIQESGVHVERVL